MIVNLNNEGWEIFSHSSHGLLAGKIANELADTFKNENWVATLAAIIEHDDRQLNFEEKNYLTEMGMPKDFLLENRSTREIIKRSKRLLSQANEKSCWIAMLISHHLQFIYKEMKGENKTISQFLSDLEQTEKSYMEELQCSKQEVDKIYQIFVFADRCSLILCQDRLPEKNREIEINTSISRKTYWLSKKQSGDMHIRPWIFAKKTFNLSTEYRLLTQSSFNDNNDFENELDKSPVKIKTWKFSK